MALKGVKKLHYRGCVLKVEKDFAIVMTDQMEYLRIIKKKNLKIGQEIIFVSGDIYKEKGNSGRRIGIVAALLAILLVSITFVGKFNVFNRISAEAVAVVSVDINPSFEFEVDRRYKVIKVVPINQDAKNLIDQSLIGKDIEQAISMIIDSAREKNYITAEKNSVLIAMVILEKNSETNHKLLGRNIEDRIRQNAEKKSVEWVYVQGHKEDLQEARKHQISIGKYEVFKQFSEKNHPINLKKARTMKIEEMVDQGIVKGKKDKKQKGVEERKEHPKDQIKEEQENKNMNLNKNNQGKVKRQVPIEQETKWNKIKDDNQKKEKKNKEEREDKQEKEENKKGKNLKSQYEKNNQNNKDDTEKKEEP